MMGKPYLTLLIESYEKFYIVNYDNKWMKILIENNKKSNKKFMENT
jgi:hypothetical protein